MAACAQSNEPGFSDGVAITAKLWDGGAYARVPLKSSTLQELQLAALVVAASTTAPAALRAAAMAGAGGIELRFGGDGGSPPGPQVDEGTWAAAVAEARTSGRAEAVVRVSLRPKEAGLAADLGAVRDALPVVGGGVASVAGQSRAAAVGGAEQKPRIEDLNRVWLPMLLPGGSSRASVLECRSVGGSIRVDEDCGRLDALGRVGKRATFILRCVGLTSTGNQVFTFESVARPGAFLASAATPFNDGPAEVDCSGAGGPDRHFEAVPHFQREFRLSSELRRKGLGAYGVLLRHVPSGRFVEVQAGRVQLAPKTEDLESQGAELFIVRYQPRYDVAWKEDGQYLGRRRWMRDQKPNFYTFAEFVRFADERGTIVYPFRERGLVAAKLLWALAWEEGASDADIASVTRLNQAMQTKRPFSNSARGRVPYSFSEMLAFVECRGLAKNGTSDLDLVKLKFGEARAPVATPAAAATSAA